MRIGVLGQLTVCNGTRQAVPSAPKPRKVLALLAVNAGSMVPASALVNELWDGAPPRSAATTLQTYVLHLRKRLVAMLDISAAEVARDVLVTRYPGYLLAIGPDGVDLHEYRDLESAGAHALRGGHDELASEHFRRALSLWRGPALMDVDLGALLSAEVARLAQSRIATVQSSIQAELRLGRHQEILAELAALTVEHPYHEALHGAYMLALYRSGWRTRALEVFHALRARLADELGIDPSPRVQRLYRALLVSAACLDDVQDIPA